MIDRGSYRLPPTRQEDAKERLVEYVDQDLQTLLIKGKSQGFLTYDEIVNYLPDEATDPSELDKLLQAVDEVGIELRSETEEEALTPEEIADASIAQDTELDRSVKDSAASVAFAREHRSAKRRYQRAGNLYRRARQARRRIRRAGWCPAL